MSNQQAPGPFKHIIVLMFENQYRSYVLQNPYMKSLAEQGIWLKNSFGVMHPSQTNYISSLSGELCNVTSDDTLDRLPQRNLVDLCEAVGVSWKAYMESYRIGQPPWGPTFQPADCFPYVIKHNPFSAFASIVDSESRWAKVDNESGFYADVLNGTLPQVSWFTPNMWSDGHYVTGADTSGPNPRAPELVDQLAVWLQAFFASLKFPGPNSHLPDDTLVVVTFDEADFETAYDQGKKSAYDGPNQIYTVLLSDRLTPGVDTEGYNHYSLLATIERNFGLGNLGKNDRGANVIRPVFGESLNWQRSPTSCTLDVAVAMANQDSSQPHQLLGAAAGAHAAWQYQIEGQPDLGLPTLTALACDSRGATFYVVYRSQSGQLGVLTCFGNTSTPLGPIPRSASREFGPSVSVAALPDGGVMVAWTEGNTVFTCRYQDDAWQAPTNTGQTTEGDQQLVCVGQNLLLIFERDGTLQYITQNLAAFNVVVVPPGTYGGPQDNTTQNVWGPSVFAVASFDSAPDPRTPGEPEPVSHAMTVSGAFFAAALDGVAHLLFRPAKSAPWMRTTFSIAGVMTPQKRVSYAVYEDATTSNGFGTAAEAGWTAPVAFGASEPGQILSLSSTGAALLCVQAGASGEVWVSQGAYA